MTSVREEILQFLQNPQGFASSLAPPRAELWNQGLTEFAQPRLVAQPLMPAQVRAWKGLANHRVGLLLGPPGTGKTHLLAWMAAGYIHACHAGGHPCRVLATGFTRESMANLLNKFAEIAAAELSGLRVAFFGNPPDGNLDRLVEPLAMKGKKGAREAWAFLEGRENWYSMTAATNWSLGKLLRSERRPDHPGLAADGHTARLFDLVLIDEASQTLVSQGLMSLSGLAREGRVVVCGDDRQLAPVRSTSEASVAGREVGGSLYRFLASAGVAEFALEETFRLNAPLVEFPAREFYAKKFVSAVPERRLALREGWAGGLGDWERLVLDPEHPVVVLLHDGPPVGTENSFERGLVVDLVQRLASRLLPRAGLNELEEETLWTKRLVVVTPHRAQNAAIRDALRPFPLCQRPRVDTVDKVQGQERDVVIVGYTVSDPEFAQVEAEFLFDTGRLNVATTRPKSKLILLCSRRLFEVMPADEETFEAADILRRFVYECRAVGTRSLPGPDGAEYPVEFRVRGFGSAAPPLLPTPAEIVAMPVTRITYSGVAPDDETIRNIFSLTDGADYLYVTATIAIEHARRKLLHHTQHVPAHGEEPEHWVARFDTLFRHLIMRQGWPVLSNSLQRIVLMRGFRDIQKDDLHEMVRHDARAWLQALNDLEQKGEDVTHGFRPELLDELASPSLAPVLTAIQKGYRKAAAGSMGFEEATRKFLDTDFQPPPLVVMEGFTFLRPLQSHFVRRCLEKGSRIGFIHPFGAGQSHAFAILNRTYQPFDGQVKRIDVATDLKTDNDLRLLQEGLFALNTPFAPQHDDSVQISVFPHRHREVAACLQSVRRYLDEKEHRAGDVAIVTRNGREFITILREEARRLGLLDRIEVEPRLLLLTPLGLFALTLYHLAPEGTLAVTSSQFETMIASGWLGAEVQKTVESFVAVRAQVFDRCEQPSEWVMAFERLELMDRSDPHLQRLPGVGVRPSDLQAWKKAFQQVSTLHARLFDGRPRSIADHITRLRDELTQLNPDDMRAEERDLVDQILEALNQVVGPHAIELDDQEMGSLMSGMARGEHRDEEETIDDSKVMICMPETLDCARRKVVHYLGVDATRVPRPAVMPWPFFTLSPDRDADLERYFFLAVVRAAGQELHLSYSRQGENEEYGPSPYLAAAAKLLDRSESLNLPVAAASAPTAIVSLPVLPGHADEFKLHDVAAFTLCPYRFRLERIDPSARRFRDPFQIRFVAFGIWLERAFDAMIGQGPFSHNDPESLRTALRNAARNTAAEASGNIPALRQLDRQAISQQMSYTIDYLVENLTSHGYPISIEAAAPGLDYSLQVDGDTVVVRSGLRHVARTGNVLRALYHALTYQHFLLPKYREEDHTNDNQDPTESIEGITVFRELKFMVAWWREAIKCSLLKSAVKDSLKVGYRQYQRELAELVRVIQLGKFPKNPGSHCELCPVRHTCLGTPEI